MENDNFGYFEILWAAIAAKNLEKNTFLLYRNFSRPNQDVDPHFLWLIFVQKFGIFQIMQKKFSSDHQKTYQINGAKKFANLGQK